MIRDIRMSDSPGIVVAQGPEYQLAQVQKFGCLILKGFLRYLDACGLSGPTTVRMWTEEGRIVDDNFFNTLQNIPLQEVAVKGRNRLTMTHGPYRIKVNLQGGDGLFLTDDGFTTTDGSPGENYDPSPSIMIISSRHTTGFLDLGDFQRAQQALSPFFSAEVVTQSLPSESMFFLKFSEEKFLKDPNETLHIDFVDMRTS